jgi:hypothetical protein
MQGSTNRRIMFQDGLGTKRNPISKITNTKKAGRVVYLPSKCEALSLTASPAKKEAIVKKDKGNKCW